MNSQLNEIIRITEARIDALNTTIDKIADEDAIKTHIRHRDLYIAELGVFESMRSE